MLSKRLKRIPISGEFMSSGQLTALTMIALMRKLPQDARIIMIDSKFISDEVIGYLFVESKEFDLRDEGIQVPDLVLELSYQDMIDALEELPEERLNTKLEANKTPVVNLPKERRVLFGCECARRSGGWYHGGHWPECKAPKQE